MDFVINYLIITAPVLDPAYGAPSESKSIDDVGASVQVNRHIAVRGILSIDHRAAPHFRFQHNRTACAATAPQPKSPAAGVIAIDTRCDNDRCSGAGETI